MTTRPPPRRGMPGWPRLAPARRAVLSRYRHGRPRTRTLCYVAGTLPIVGRSAERAVLSAAYARAAAGEPRVVLVTGAAGIGKTRLVDELTGQAGQAGAQVRAGESAPLSGAALAYRPFVAALEEQAAWLLEDDGPGGMLAARDRLFLPGLQLPGALAARPPLRRLLGAPPLAHGS